MARPKKPKENIVETPSLFEKDEEHGLTEMQNGLSGITQKELAARLRQQEEPGMSFLVRLLINY